MTALVLVDPGELTTIQDGGRVGHARHGVPRSGPVDRLAHRLAARLAGFPPDRVRQAVAVEVGPRPTTVRAEGGELVVALAGAAELVVGAVTVPAPCVVVLPPDVDTEVRARTWAYLVPAGDPVDVPEVLGSRSVHHRSGLGPPLGPSTRLPVPRPRDVRAGRRRSPVLPGGDALGVLPAPQTQRFTAAARERLVNEEFRTTTGFDRMGHRLAGPPLPAREGHDIVSDGIVAGTVQVPGDAQPFVLTADHQTTGGYPKIAVLSAVALSRFVRLPPGTPLRFRWTDVASARRQLRLAHEEVERVVGGAVAPTALQLERENLIGGVVDGR